MSDLHYVPVLVTQPCLTLCDPMECSPPASSVHGILQARILEWVPISFSRGFSQPTDQTQLSCIAGKQLKQENVDSHAYTSHSQTLESKNYRASLESRERKIKHSRKGNNVLVNIWIPWYSDGEESSCNAGDLGSVAGLGISPGGEHGNPLQYSCLENPWTEVPGGLQSVGSQRAGHNWATKHKHSTGILWSPDRVE